MANYHKPLTIKTIEAIKPPNGIKNPKVKHKAKSQQDEYYDTNQTGFLLRLGTSGKKVFYQRYRVGKKQGRIKIGTYPTDIGLREAREKGKEYLKKANIGEDPALEKRRSRAGGLLFKDLSKMYVEQYAKPKKRTWKEDEQKLEKKFSDWDDMEANSITHEDVFDRIEYIKKNHGPIAANRNLALIRKVFKWAKEKRLVKESPVRDISKEPENTRDNILTDKQIKAFWGGCESHGYPFGTCYQVMLITGRRLGSVSKMKWTDLDLEAKEWTIPSELDKSGKPQVVPLPTLVIETLIDIQENHLIEDSEYVFTTNGKAPISGFSKSKVKLDKLSKLSGWTLHDLRRTCRTNLPRLGVTPDISKLTMGHKLQGVDAIYDRYSYMPEKRDALEKWANYLQGLIADKENKVVSIA